MSFEGRAALVLKNPRHEAFCRHWVFGSLERGPSPGSGDMDTRHNAYLSYVAAGYRARGTAARACASRLLTRANIRERIAELRDEEGRLQALYLRRWGALLPAAQQVLVDAMEGKEVTSQQLVAAREVIEQAQGPAHLRFGLPHRPHDGGTIQVTLWSGVDCRDGATSA